MNTMAHDIATPNPTGKYYGFWSFTMLFMWVLLWAVILPWPNHGFWILSGTYVLADAYLREKRQHRQG